MRHCIWALLLAAATSQHATPVADAQLVPQTSSLAQSINQARVQASLSPLAEEAALDELASERSADMGNRHYFSHTNPDGLTVFDLLQSKGIGYATAGEDLALNWLQGAAAEQFAFDQFMSSSPHRANLFRPEFSRVGVGAYFQDGRTYVTVVLLG